MNTPAKEVHHGNETWVNKEADAIRRDNCMCLFCGKLKPKQPDNCPTAELFFGQCVEHEMAMIVTRCDQWVSPEPK